MAVQIAAAAKAALKAKKALEVASSVRGESGDGSKAAKIVLALVLATAMVPLCAFSSLASGASGNLNAPAWMTTEFVTAAFEARDKYGIPVSAGLRQMCLENGSDDKGSRLGYDYHNYAGVKWAGQKKASGSVRIGKSVWACFKDDASWLDYYYNTLLQQSNYKDRDEYKRACKSNDPHLLLVALGDGGYCENETGESYAKKAEACCPALAQLDMYATAAEAVAALSDQQPSSSGDSEDFPLVVAPNPYAAKVIAVAKSQLGVTYVWGGETLRDANHSGALDCSGLTMRCYEAIGVELSHYTVSQWDEVTRVRKGQEQPGDIVFFRNSSGFIHHVGIYLGADKFIHAPHRGDVVKVSKLSDRSDEYCGAGRVVPKTMKGK